MSRPRVEILYFESCPNHEPARALVERLARELDVEPEIALVEVTGHGEAVALHFLGSPTVRVDGHDVEPGADRRRDFGMRCRLYATDEGLRETPLHEWILDALSRPTRDML